MRLSSPLRNPRHDQAAIGEIGLQTRMAERAPPEVWSRGVNVRAAPLDWTIQVDDLRASGVSPPRKPAIYVRLERAKLADPAPHRSWRVGGELLG